MKFMPVPDNANDLHYLLRSVVARAVGGSTRLPLVSTRYRNQILAPAGASSCQLVQARLDGASCRSETPRVQASAKTQRAENERIARSINKGKP